MFSLISASSEKTVFAALRIFIFKCSTLSHSQNVALFVRASKPAPQ